MRLCQTYSVLAFAASEFKHDRVVVSEKLMPTPFQREALLLDAFKRIFKEIVKGLALGKTFEFVFLSHGTIFYVTAKRLRYTLSL